MNWKDSIFDFEFRFVLKVFWYLEFLSFEDYKKRHGRQCNYPFSTEGYDSVTQFPKKQKQMHGKHLEIICDLTSCHAHW